MFKSPGNKLQILAAVILGLISAVFLIAGIFLAGVITSNTHNTAYGVLIFLGYSAVGVLIGWLNSIVLYAFGTLVDDIGEMRMHLNELIHCQRTSKADDRHLDVSVE